MQLLSRFGAAGTTLCGTAVLVFAAVPAYAASVEPGFIAGNPSCADLNSQWTEVKYEPVQSGTHEVGDGSLTVSVTVDGATRTFDFTATPGVDAVIVKGGPNALVYAYEPDATGDTGLHAPVNPENGDYYGLSHISFCSGPDAPPPPPPGGGDPTPGGQTPAPGQQPAAVTDPGTATPPAAPPAAVEVLGARAVASSAVLKSASGCAKQAFTASVSGRGIDRVTFYLDGRRIKTVHNPSYRVRISPTGLTRGAHRVTARVVFVAAAQRGPATRRMTFLRCAHAAQAPRFTG